MRRRRRRRRNLMWLPLLMEEKYSIVKIIFSHISFAFVVEVIKK